MTRLRQTQGTGGTQGVPGTPTPGQPGWATVPCRIGMPASASVIGLLWFVCLLLLSFMVLLFDDLFWGPSEI